MSGPVSANRRTGHARQLMARWHAPAVGESARPAKKDRGWHTAETFFDGGPGRIYTSIPGRPHQVPAITIRLASADSLWPKLLSHAPGQRRIKLG